ncbi:MAG: ABC transporter ATP-binding protein [Actinobacteria bacterium]|nr:ABC transporter ATP-binding protein [Actinomycetota bacterium]MDA2961320.1 ABC transporter ATP-binding protein [Actinomycetota bacterium]MDA2993832.1 ABC transporter ATP-binding protein [Actinomycetota bacterium]
MADSAPVGSGIRSVRETNWSHLIVLLKAQWVGISAGVGLGLVWTVGKIAVPLLTQSAVDKAIVGDGSAFVWAIGIACAGLFTGVLTAGRRFFAFKESRMVETMLRERIHDHVLGLHPEYHDNAQTGQLMSRMSSDLNQVQMFVVMIPLTLSHVALILGVTGVLISLDPFLALIALLPLPFVNVSAKLFSNAIHPAVLAVQAEQAQLSTVVEESIAGVRVVKGFGAEAVRMKALETEADDIRNVSLRAAQIRAKYMPFLELLPLVGLVGVLGVGGLRVIDGSMTIGELVAFNFFVTLLVWPLRSIGMTVAFGQRAAAALERVHEVLSVEPAIADPPEPLVLPEISAGRMGAVRFSDVGFAYGAGARVLDRFDLDIEAGESIAIVGATGSGKSTIARLLLRFYDPQQGSITLDGIDLRSLRVDELRRTIGIVFEDTLLFHDTVAANIAFTVPSMDLQAEAGRIRAAAELAGAAGFIDDLPDGYDTVLGERGYSLSGGQRQRIAIARAIISNPRMLILDDATSAVDPSKEHEIRSAMATVMDGRTTLVIAHRPGTIAMADKVVLLDDGCICATGKHQELLDSYQPYREVLAALEPGESEAVVN